MNVKYRKSKDNPRDNHLYRVKASNFPFVLAISLFLFKQQFTPTRSVDESKDNEGNADLVRADIFLRSTSLKAH